MFSKVYNIKKEKGHNCKKGEFLFCFNFFSWQFLDYTNHASLSSSFFPSLFQQTRKKLREKLQKKSQGRRNQRAEHQTKLWLPVQMIQTLTAVWMWRSGRNCCNRWQVRVCLKEKESLNALFMGERVKDEVMKRILEKWRGGYECFLLVQAGLEGVWWHELRLILCWDVLKRNADWIFSTKTIGWLSCGFLVPFCLALSAPQI